MADTNSQNTVRLTGKELKAVFAKTAAEMLLFTTVAVGAPSAILAAWVDRHHELGNIGPVADVFRELGQGIVTLAANNPEAAAATGAVAVVGLGKIGLDMLRGNGRKALQKKRQSYGLNNG